MGNNSKLKKGLFLFFLILFIFQIIFFSEINKLSYKYPSTINALKDASTQNQTILINDTIRPQQRLMLQSIKQTWINYTNDKAKKLIQVDSASGEYPVYSTEDGHTVLYNSNTMYKESIKSNYYNIYSKDNNSLIISNAKPKWNTEELDKILELLVTPVKSFGNSGGVIVYDSNSGEIFLDTTQTSRLKNGKSNIFEDNTNYNCKNANETSCDIDNYIKIKKDSGSIDSFIYMFNEETKMRGEAGNFSKYPLGDYNRLFIEKMILPYESFGFDGQPMQLTVLLIADEYDIYSAYKVNDNNMKKSLNITLELNSKTKIILICSIAITMIYLLVIAYVFKYSNNLKDEVYDKKGGQKF